jgi:hypothetical protein
VVAALMLGGMELAPTAPAQAQEGVRVQIDSRDEASGVRAIGAALEGIRTGVWRFERRDGSVLFVGEYGPRGLTGPCAYYRPDGTLDDECYSGDYLDGERVGPLTGLPAGAPEPAAALDPLRVVAPEASARATELVEAFLASDGPAPRALVEQPREAYHARVRRLLACDLADPADVRVAERLHRDLLGRVCGAAWEWHAGTGPESAAANARNVLRWATFLDVMAGREEAFAAFRPEEHWVPVALEFTVLAHPPAPLALTSGWADVGLVGIGIGGKYGMRFGGRRSLKARGGAGTEEPQQDASSWVAERASPEGGWRAAEHGGDARFDVGVTAMCALALLGDTSGLASGPHHATLEAAMRWLVRRQDPRTGELAGSHGEAVYEHALATTALGEYAQFADRPAVHQALRRGVDFLLAARTPDGAWPLVRGADGDAATTAATLLALRTADAGGCGVAADVFARGLAWLSAQAKPSGALRAPPGERALAPMGEHGATAAAVLAAFFVGANPARDAWLESAASWLAARPPLADRKQPAGDPQYVFWGIHAAYQLGGTKHFQRWNEGMKKVLLANREPDALALAGHGGGALFAAACKSLSLQVYYRYGRILPAR